MEKVLDNKVIVISGGTKGIGKGIAIKAARQGAKVVISGRDKAAAEKILKEIHSNNNEAIFVPTDLHSVKDCENLFREAICTYGQVDGFVNYAGVTYKAPITECDECVFDDIFDINIKAAFFCTKYAIQSMRERGGSIVIFGSPHDDKGEKDRAAYACSKGALSVLVTHVAKYYAEDHIRANYITMGWTPTEGELALREKEGISEEELRSRASRIIPAGRMQEIEDHVPAVLYLLSDASLMVTGSNFRITGGLYF